MEKQEHKFKLNYKRTFYIGLAFFTILMLWQVYNTYCPIFLTDLLIENFGGTSADWAYLVGIIMAADNVLALFMLPLFGALSDKTQSKLGKRMPFIIAGTLAAVLLFPLIALLFLQKRLVWLIIVMALILVAMNLYRSPAVSLMPDVTPKPLRSKANAVINLVGYLGAICAGIMAMFIKVSADETGRAVYDPNTVWIPFVVTAVLMIVALVILLLKIKENKLAEELKEEMELGEAAAETNEAILEDKPLGKRDKANLWIMLVSIFLWFFAFNAIETFGSLFGLNQLGETTGWWGTAVIIMTISSIIAFIPAGWIADKIGRKNSIILGLALLIFGVFMCCIISTPWLFYPFIALAGIGWAWVNVNSYPMIVELSSKKNVGKFTGWYYSASMLAQSITPICVGFLFKWLGYGFLFWYAFIFAVIALIVFMFYKTSKKKIDSNENQAENKSLDNEQNGNQKVAVLKTNNKLLISALNTETADLTTENLQEKVAEKKEDDSVQGKIDKNKNAKNNSKFTTKTQKNNAKTVKNENFLNKETNINAENNVDKQETKTKKSTKTATKKQNDVVTKKVKKTEKLDETKENKIDEVEIKMSKPRAKGFNLGKKDDDKN